MNTFIFIKYSSDEKKIQRSIYIYICTHTHTYICVYIYIYIYICMYFTKEGHKELRRPILKLILLNKINLYF